ncbi:MAG: DASS family sodium-coupled anion symporter [Candidatus Omnitrophica bacterium]|nr:DASS family sodium-coupled anion symporter [Candidatus Omnitrophota bacterium]
MDAVGKTKNASFDAWRKTAGLLLGPLGALAILLRRPEGLSEEAHCLSAIICLVILFWLTEPVPLAVTALLGVALSVLAGIAPAKEVLASFGDPVIFLFIGSFMIARGMQVHGLDRRIAYTLLSHPWVGGSTYRTLWTMGLTAWIISMWVSNTATVAMLFPVALAIARLTTESMAADAGGNPAMKRLRYPAALLLFLSYAASIGGLATPVGTPPNLIGIALIEQGLGVRIGFLSWMAVALPVALLLLAACYGIILFLFPPEIRRVPGQLDRLLEKRRSLGHLAAGERNTMIVFFTAVILWTGPGIVALTLGPAHPLSQALEKRLPEGIAAILAAGLLFLLPVSWRKREFTLRWEDAVQIDWATVLLFGGGIALGRMMFETGLASAMGNGLIRLLGVESPAALAATATFASTLISETASNTASANMAVPVMLSVAKASKETELMLGVAATMGASLGFMLPVSTPPNAIVYGSGAIRITDMVRAGFLVDLIGGLIVWATAVLWVPRILPMGG